MDRKLETSSSASGSGRSVLATVALLLLAIGGLNWALVGLFDFDLVAALFGDMSVLSRAVYVLVGIAAVVVLALLPRLSRRPVGA